MRDYCLHCLRSQNSCFCSSLKGQLAPFRPFVFIHPKEFRSKTGTGRMSYLQIQDALLYQGDIFPESKLSDHTYLLYPGDDALSASEIKNSVSETTSHDSIKPTIVVIDGTWAAAKKMLKLSPALQKLPKVKISPQTESQFRFKKQPIDGCLSTIESLAQLWLEWAPEQKEQIDIFLRPFSFMIDYQIKAQNDPLRNHYRNRSFKGDRNLLPKANRWRHRPVFFQSR